MESAVLPGLSEAIVVDAPLPAGLRHTAIQIDRLLCPPPSDILGETFANKLRHDVFADELDRVHRQTPGAGSAKYLQRATTSCSALWVTGNQPPGILIT
ncbi:hypothetical protein sch_09725 [Serratia plymuthica]|nr:hypothetical protein sch_09725 [Serratia plymuthica]